MRGKRDKPRNEPGVYEPDGRVISDVPLQGMQIAWFMMEAINRGYVATVQWDAYTGWYDRYMQYGTIGGVKDGWPLRPAYHVLRMFTHTTQPGWRAVRVAGEQQGMLASATQGPGGELAMYVLNRGDRPSTVNLSGLPVRTTMHVLLWNGDGKGTLSTAANIVTTADGSLTIDAPAGGVVALCTIEPKL